MFNYYIYEHSYTAATCHDLERNLKCLSDLIFIEKKEDDCFYKHDSFLLIKTQDGILCDVLFSKLEDVHFMRLVLPKLLGAIPSLPEEITSLEDFDKKFVLYNAFYGFKFENSSKRYITSKEEYVKFRYEFLWENTPLSIWEKRRKLFKNIILCDGVKDNLKEIGGTYLGQIVEHLKILDSYCDNCWKEGEFSYKDANQKSALVVSPESQTTMKNEKLKQMRVFSLPDGRRVCFELHIKTGNLRFHFYPENQLVYIGYIGKHLPI